MKDVFLKLSITGYRAATDPSIAVQGIQRHQQQQQQQLGTRPCPRVWLHCRQWAAEMREKDPDFFNRLVNQQNPEYLWIGCSDSRVPVS